jgi:hypothetical protein
MSALGPRVESALHCGESTDRRGRQSCGDSGGTTPQSINPNAIVTGATTRVPASSTTGRTGSRLAFYDGQQHTINFNELPPTAEQQVLANNAQINIIYCVVDCQVKTGFIAVINAIQGEGPGFNPLWQEVHISFNPGTTPHQFTSDDQILAAAAAGQITLTPTTEVYRCSVIGGPTPAP